MPAVNFSGLASGIDSESLISATSASTRAVKVTPSKNKISELEDTNKAFSDLKSKMQALKASILTFKTSLGGVLTKRAASSDETVVTASASSSAVNGAYDITVSQLARNGVLTLRSTAGAYTSSSGVIAPSINNADPAANRTVTIEVGQGTNKQTAAIPITSTMTLDEFVSEFNESVTNAVASVVQVSSTDYRVVITGSTQGLVKGEIAITSGTSVSGQNVFNSNILQNATNSQMQITGVTSGIEVIERDTNSITDVIPGLTLSLTGVSTSSAKITITDDANATATKVKSFLDAYNEIVKYIRDNNVIERQENGSSVSNIFSPLANTRLDDNALSALRSALTGSTYTSGSEVRIFADVGIKTERDGSLGFDQTKFNAAISNESNSVNQVFKNFADTAALEATGTIDQYTGFNRLFDSTINSNKNLIRDLNARIATAEALILSTEKSLRRKFSALEATVGRLQSQQGALTSALAGLNGG